MDSFEITEEFSASPSELYNAWLDSVIHGGIIGSDAEIDPKVNGKFNIWDGYINGTTIELVKGKKIVQKWRTAEFPKDSKDSKLELEFSRAKSGAKINLKHSGLPDGTGDEYKQGWIDYYFTPMKKYFSK